MISTPAPVTLLSRGGKSRFGELPADENVDEQVVEAMLIKKGETIFCQQIDPSRISLYFGFKTELASAAQAWNYQHHIIEAGDYVLALPGKMSLAFTLAVNVCRHVGVDPVLELQGGVVAEDQVSGSQYVFGAFEEGRNIAIAHVKVEGRDWGH